MPLNQKKSETVWLLASLGLLVLLSFFAALGSAPLFDVDEGAFSEATREMMISKNYLTTYLNGAPRFDKPILIYWLQLSAVKLFGLNEFAFRLPSALAGTVWASAIFLFVRKESDNRQAFLAAAMMVLSLQVIVIAKAAIADGLLNCLLAVTMFALLHHYKTGSKQALHLAFAAAGLGMLTKGPIAIIIPFAVTLLFSLQERAFKKWLQMILNPLGIIIFLIIALPWYLLEYRDQGMAFIDGFFFKHNISRFNSSLEGHSGSLFYYLPVIIIGMLPFTGLFFYRSLQAQNAACRQYKPVSVDLVRLCFYLFFSLRHKTAALHDLRLHTALYSHGQSSAINKAPGIFGTLATPHACRTCLPPLGSAKSAL
jgi:4-amino-4-deoxy-L-arabinose transferase-like glycosyltransferase